MFQLNAARPALAVALLAAIFGAIEPSLRGSDTAATGGITAEERAHAAQYLKQAQSLMDQTSSLSDLARQEIAETQAKLGDIAAAKTTALAITSHTFAVESLYGIAVVQSRSGDPARATATLRLAQQQNESAKNPEDRDEGLRLVGVSQIDLGDLSGTKQTAASLVPSWQKAEVLTRLAEAEANAGDAASAKENFAAAQAALAASDRKMPFWSYIDIASIQAAVGDIDGAYRTAGRITDELDRAVCHAEIAAEQARKGDAKGARNSATSAWRDLSDAGPAEADKRPGHVRVLTAVAVSLARAGEQEMATAILTQAGKEAALIENSEDGPESLAAVALAQSEVGQGPAARQTMKLALDAVSRVSNEGSRVHALWMIAGDQARWDAADAARTVARAMREGIIDPSETAMLAMNVARAMTRSLRTKADVAWIERLADPEEKCLAYAGAAAGMVDH
jgi:tetratricopeptide (TPR) repeat protein